MCLNSEPYNLNFATLNLRALSELQCIIFLQQHMYGMSKKKKKKLTVLIMCSRVINLNDKNSFFISLVCICF